MKEEISKYLYNLFADLVQTELNVTIFIWLLVCSIIVLDSIYTLSKKKREKIGISKKDEGISDIIKQQKILPGDSYISPIQQLSGKPDAIILENSFLIPVERKPFAKKIRDRYIAQLLVYMRLIEEFEGKKPPYGYLILGKNSRRIKIDNSKERQAWLQTFIDEMHAILEHNEKAIPSPHPKKCGLCSTRYACDFAIVNINREQKIKKQIS